MIFFYFSHLKDFMKMFEKIKLVRLILIYTHYSKHSTDKG